MTDVSKTLNAWATNYESTIAVQGESNGRTINVTVIDRKGQTDNSFTSESVDRPVDLTDASVRLYIHKPDNTTVFTDGTVTDATNGICSFVLPYQATTVAGSATCEVLMTWADNRTLKAVGLTLNVLSSNLEGAVESSDEFSALVVALNEIAQSVVDAQTAVTNANTAIDGANTARDNANSAATAANTAADTANTAASNADAKAALADTATTNANTATTNANAAISAAETATTNANTAADRANTAAQNAEDAIAGQLDPSIDARIAAQKNQPNGIAGLDETGKVPSAQLPEMDYVPNTEKGQPNGIATLDSDGHILTAQLNMNFLGKLIVHVAAEDGGSVTGTRVRIRNEQLGSNYVQTLDALGNTTFSLLDNHTYYVVLLDYPSQYYGAAATVTITGGETQEVTLTLKTEPDIVGLKINASTGEVAYTDGAEDFEPMSMSDGTLNPGSWEGHWALDVKPCLLKNMVVQYYLKKTGFLLYDYEHQANGTSSDIRSGDDGDVMNELPLMYYKFFSQTDPDGTAYRCFKLAKEPQDDTWCCNAFLNRSGVAQSTIYLPAYKGTIYNNKLRSLCDVAPTVSTTIGAFRTAANANGTGYEICEAAKRTFLQALFILLFRSTDGQSSLGKGTTSASNAVNSGTLNDKPLIWGDQTGTNGMKFMGIEHFWGNVFDWMDGISQTSSDFLYKIYGPYNDSGSGYLTGPALPDTGYINDMNFANGYGMVPSATVSSESDSQYHDYFYQGSSGYVRRVGGYWSYGPNAGPFSWNGNAASDTDTNVGASLFATPQ